MQGFFFSSRNPKILGKERKTHKKQGKSEHEKNARKSNKKKKQGKLEGQGSAPIKIAQSQSLALSALTEPNRQKSRRKKGLWAQKSQLEIANR